MATGPSGREPSRLLPHHPDIATSRANAERLTPKHPNLRARALRWFAYRGAKGATRAELALSLGIGIQSVCPVVFRMREAGEIEETGEVRHRGNVLRITRQGLDAVV